MSRRSIYLSIPEPCHEGWENMDATERGAFCHSCQKEVIDFSAMTDREVIEHLEKHKAGCGRFRKDLLETKLTIPQIDNGIFRWRALMLGVLPLFSFKAVFAHQPPGIFSGQNPIENNDQDKSVKPVSEKISINGIVICENDKLPMIGATITLLDTSENKLMSATTDIDGKFLINIDRRTITTSCYKLKVSYDGSISKVIAISNKADQHYKIKLREDPSKVTTGLTVVTYYKPHTPAQKIKYWFRHTFRVKKKRS